MAWIKKMMSGQKYFAIVFMTGSSLRSFRTMQTKEIFHENSRKEKLCNQYHSKVGNCSFLLLEAI